MIEPNGREPEHGHGRAKLKRWRENVFSDHRLVNTGEWQNRIEGLRNQELLRERLGKICATMLVDVTLRSQRRRRNLVHDSGGQRDLGQGG